jgi:hypothetical protein
MWEAMRNPHFLFLLLGLFFLSVMLGTRETLGIYMATFFWELSPRQIGWLFLGSLIGYVAGFTLTRRVHHRIDKHATIVLAAIGLSVFGGLSATLRPLGLAPDNGTWTLVAFMIGWGSLSASCGSILNISVMSALADIADDNELTTGRRQEGVFYSAQLLREDHARNRPRDRRGRARHHRIPRQRGARQHRRRHDLRTRHRGRTIRHAVRAPGCVLLCGLPHRPQAPRRDPGHARRAGRALPTGVRIFLTL